MQKTPLSPATLSLRNLLPTGLLLAATLAVGTLFAVVTPTAQADSHCWTTCGQGGCLYCCQEAPDIVNCYFIF